MAFAWGAEYTYQAILVQHQYCCRIAEDKFVVVYQDTIAPFGGVAVVGSVVGNVITFGVPSQFSAGMIVGPTPLICCPLDNDKFVVIFGDMGVGPMFGQARVGVVTGTNIAWGAPATFNAGWILHPSCCNIGTDKFAVSYHDNVAGNGEVCICDVAGNVITPGAPVVFDAGGCFTSSSIRLEDDKFVVAYRTAALFLDLFIVTVVGNVPTPHASTNFQNFSQPAQFGNGMALVDTNLLAISWRRGGGGVDPNNAHCVRMGSIAGNVITAGPSYVLNPFPEYTDCIGVEALTTNPAQFAVLYPNDAAGGALGHGTLNVLDFTGTTITNFGAKQYFKAGAINHFVTANLLNGKLAVAFNDIIPVTGDGMIGIFLNPPAVTTDPATGVT